MATKTVEQLQESEKIVLSSEEQAMLQKGLAKLQAEATAKLTAQIVENRAAQALVEAVKAGFTQLATKHKVPKKDLGKIARTRAFTAWLDS